MILYADEIYTEATTMGIIEKVIQQIKEDLQFGDLSAIEELLSGLPPEHLTAFLEQD
jgi:hypothetical protein